MLDITEQAAFPVYLRINQFYFPGWDVTVNGDTVPMGGKTSEGVYLRFAANARIRMEFSQPGHYRIDARFAGPVHWQARNLIMLFCCIVFGMLFMRHCRKWRTRLDSHQRPSPSEEDALSSSAAEPCGSSGKATGAHY